MGRNTHHKSNKKMEHMKFKRAEYILGIQRLRNEVFTIDTKTLCVFGDDTLKGITAFICDKLKARNSSENRRRCYSVKRVGSYLTVVLHGPYHWEYSPNEEEILLVKGYNRMYVVDDLGNPVSHDYGIDIMDDIQTLKEMKEGKLC